MKQKREIGKDAVQYSHTPKLKLGSEKKIAYCNEMRINKIYLLLYP